MTPRSSPARAELPVGKVNSELPAGCQASGEELISTAAPHPLQASRLELSSREQKSPRRPGGRTRELACRR